MLTNRYCAGICVLAAITIGVPSWARTGGTPTSFLPNSGIERFIVDQFDIATIRSSLGPRRAPHQVRFADLGIRPRSIRAGHIELRDERGWSYEITILRRTDLNNDGIEDVAVCFVDNGRGAGGTYFDVQPLLLTRFSRNSALIAISYKPDDDRCKETAH